MLAARSANLRQSMASLTVDAPTNESPQRLPSPNGAEEINSLEWVRAEVKFNSEVSSLKYFHFQITEADGAVKLTAPNFLGSCNLVSPKWVMSLVPVPCAPKEVLQSVRLYSANLHVRWWRYRRDGFTRLRFGAAVIRHGARANGSRERALDDSLREAIHRHKESWIA